ncbi:MAG TPA: epimerase [Myxococcaceae bacterium]|nr:epimerase [Myxococcaceae bacterium]
MKVLLFGGTGMVGQSVLGACLRDDAVTEVVAIGRTPTGRTHPRLRELVRKDLFAVDVPDAELQGYAACFFCLGVSSAGMGEAEYTRLTYDLTLAWARALARVNPGMAFLYVSGVGTGGKAMWAQVKGRTEAALLGLFRDAYMVRLGLLRPVHGEVSRTRWARVLYAVLGPVAPLIQAVAPGMVITSEELGRAMIRAARERPPTHVLEMRDLQALARG